VAAGDRIGYWRGGFGGFGRDRAIARSRTEPASRVERARVLLVYREDPSFFKVGRAVGVHHQTAQRCVERALAFGPMAALDDRPRPGKEPTITVEAKAWVVDLACRKAKELGYPHELWTTRLLARRAREHGRQRGTPVLPSWLKARCATYSMSRR
jgi:transposase